MPLTNCPSPKISLGTVTSTQKIAGALNQLEQFSQAARETPLLQTKPDLLLSLDNSLTSHHNSFSLSAENRHVTETISHRPHAHTTDSTKILHQHTANSSHGFTTQGEPSCQPQGSPPQPLDTFNYHLVANFQEHPSITPINNEEQSNITDETQYAATSPQNFTIQGESTYQHQDSYLSLLDSFPPLLEGNFQEHPSITLINNEDQSNITAATLNTEAFPLEVDNDTFATKCFFCLEESQFITLHQLILEETEEKAFTYKLGIIHAPSQHYWLQYKHLIDTNLDTPSALYSNLVYALQREDFANSQCSLNQEGRHNPTTAVKISNINNILSTYLYCALIDRYIPSDQNISTILIESNVQNAFTLLVQLRETNSCFQLANSYTSPTITMPTYHGSTYEDQQPVIHAIRPEVMALEEQVHSQSILLEKSQANWIDPQQQTASTSIELSTRAWVNDNRPFQPSTSRPSLQAIATANMEAMVNESYYYQTPFHHLTEQESTPQILGNYPKHFIEPVQTLQPPQYIAAYISKSHKPTSVSQLTTRKLWSAGHINIELPIIQALRAENNLILKDCTSCNTQKVTIENVIKDLESGFFEKIAPLKEGIDACYQESNTYHSYYVAITHDRTGTISYIKKQSIELKVAEIDNHFLQLTNPFIAGYKFSFRTALNYLRFLGNDKAASSKEGITYTAFCTYTQTLTDEKRALIEKRLTIIAGIMLANKLFDAIEAKKASNAMSKETDASSTMQNSTKRQQKSNTKNPFIVHDAIKKVNLYKFTYLLHEIKQKKAWLDYSSYQLAKSSSSHAIKTEAEANIDSIEEVAVSQSAIRLRELNRITGNDLFLELEKLNLDHSWKSENKSSFDNPIYALCLPITINVNDNFSCTLDTSDSHLSILYLDESLLENLNIVYFHNEKFDKNNLIPSIIELLLPKQYHDLAKHDCDSINELISNNLTTLKRRLKQFTGIKFAQIIFEKLSNMEPLPQWKRFFNPAITQVISSSLKNGTLKESLLKKNQLFMGQLKRHCLQGHASAVLAFFMQHWRLPTSNEIEVLYNKLFNRNLNKLPNNSITFSADTQTPFTMVTVAVSQKPLTLESCSVISTKLLKQAIVIFKSEKEYSIQKPPLPSRQVHALSIPFEISIDITQGIKLNTNNAHLSIITLDKDLLNKWNSVYLQKSRSHLSLFIPAIIELLLPEKYADLPNHDNASINMLIKENLASIQRLLKLLLGLKVTNTLYQALTESEGPILGRRYYNIATTELISEKIQNGTLETLFPTYKEVQLSQLKAHITKGHSNKILAFFMQKWELPTEDELAELETLRERRDKRKATQQAPPPSLAKKVKSLA